MASSTALSCFSSSSRRFACGFLICGGRANTGGGLLATIFAGGGSWGGVSGFRLLILIPVSDSPLSSSWGNTGLSSRLTAGPLSVSLICCFWPESFMGSIALLLDWPYDTVPCVSLLFTLALLRLSTLDAELLWELLEWDLDLVRDLVGDLVLDLDLDDPVLDRDLDRLDENVLPALPLERERDRDLENVSWLASFLMRPNLSNLSRRGTLGGLMSTGGGTTLLLAVTLVFISCRGGGGGGEESLMGDRVLSITPLLLSLVSILFILGSGLRGILSILSLSSILFGLISGLRSILSILSLSSILFALDSGLRGILSILSLVSILFVLVSGLRGMLSILGSLGSTGLRGIGGRVCGPVGGIGLPPFMDGIDRKPDFSLSREPGATR